MFSPLKENSKIKIQVRGVHRGDAENKVRVEQPNGKGLEGGNHSDHLELHHMETLWEMMETRLGIFLP